MHSIAILKLKIFRGPKKFVKKNYKNFKMPNVEDTVSYILIHVLELDTKKYLFF